jgi:hypothetical protein
MNRTGRLSARPGRGPGLMLGRYGRGATTVAYAHPERRTRLLLSADLAVTAGLLLSTAALQYPSAMRHGVMPVTAIWVAGPVLAWAVQYGRRAGAIAALVISGCDFLLRSEAITVVLNGVVLLLLAGEAAELGRLAGQQEAALRSLVGGAQAGGGPAGDVDLRALVLPIESDQVTVSAPAQAVRLEKAAADELASAIRAALDNVRRHGGERARAWVLVEDEPGLVTVTVRDDGPGIPDGRLAEAAAAGRLGVSHSICGRLRDLGGSATIRSVPGEGTEVELRLPRAGGAPLARAPGAG